MNQMLKEYVYFIIFFVVLRIFIKCIKFYLEFINLKFFTPYFLVKIPFPPVSNYIHLFPILLYTNDIENKHNIYILFYIQ